MGIGGHILGPKRLRRLNRDTGKQFDRAVIRGHDATGVVWTPDGCEHYEIDERTWESVQIVDPVHWFTCNSMNRVGLAD